MATSGRILAFGEVILRFSPPRGELLLSSNRMNAWVGGSEANVAAQLARLGHEVAMVTRLPSNDLGRAAIAALRGHGVRTDLVSIGGERIGLYFVTPGAGLRATDAVYDRAGSSFAEAPPEMWDWASMLDGVDHLHLSGITPALGPSSADHALAACEAARAQEIAISFDGNWRGKLWERWQGDAPSILRRMAARARILFGDHRDIALMLGSGPFCGEAIEIATGAAKAAFEAFPDLEVFASTHREVTAAAHQRIGARLFTRQDCFESPAIEVPDVVDRIGSGDAFVAGVLHGLRSGGGFQSAVEDGLALAVLKLTLAGDASVFSLDHLSEWRIGHRDVRR